MFVITFHEGYFSPAIGPDDPRYLPPIPGDAFSCNAVSPNRYCCTREPGHDGDHAAHGTLRQCFERWPR